jgi:cytochrome c-type biogenesis protein CcmH
MSGSKARGAQSPATLALVAALLVGAAALVFAATRGPAEPSGVQVRVRAVASGLRCPVCQNLSVADSPSALAREMRSTIERRLRAGESADRIRAGFVRAYGDWILLDPPRRGINLVAWLAPLALLVGGLIVAIVAVRRWTAASRDEDPASPSADGAAAEAMTEPDRRRLAAAIAESESEPE